MRKAIYILLGLLFIVVIITVVIPALPTEGPHEGPIVTSVEDQAALVIVSSPLPNAHISSPVSISGKAVGNWYFEASFPILIEDAAGNIIGQGHASAQGNWMTNDQVPFRADIEFTRQPAGSKGSIVLKNDNPSGLPENDKSLTIPVQF